MASKLKSTPTSVNTASVKEHGSNWPIAPTYLDILPSVAGLFVILSINLEYGPLAAFVQQFPTVAIFSVTPILAVASIILSLAQRRKFTILTWINLAWLIVSLGIVLYLIEFSLTFQW